MDNIGSVSLRVCLDGHANSLALNKENNCIAVAGRSREYLFSFFKKLLLLILKAQFLIFLYFQF